MLLVSAVMIAIGILGLTGDIEATPVIGGVLIVISCSIAFELGRLYER